MRTLRRAGVVVAAALVGTAATGAAQVSENITAQANVLTGLAVTAQSDLDFGDVLPGVAKSIAITDVGAGSWQITGNASAEVTLGFTLPTNLTNGGNTLPISFGASDAGHNVANLAAGATTFDPSAGTTTDIGSLPAELYVWVGGTVSPGASQATGLYTGTVTLTVQYTGN